MSFRNRLRIRKVRNRDKVWVEVQTPHDGSLVAFEDVFDMVRFIVECEHDKYTKGATITPESYERWGAQSAAVLKHAWKYGTDWDALAAQFDLPRRDGSRPPVTRQSSSVLYPGSKGQNHDGTWGELGWFTEALYREWG